MLDNIKEFKPSNWAIDNRTSIYLLTIFLLLAGGMAWNTLPKEQFPEVVFPQIMVNTIYPGTSPENMESLISKEIEKECKGVTGVKKITSNSIENFSSVMIEFGTSENVAVAKQRVKDAVDKASLPSDLREKPSVIDIDISQVPIMNVHVSGDLSLDRIKKYADILQDRIEAMKQISRVDMVGALDREIQVNVDMYKMTANSLTLTDIERGISGENLTISGGSVDMGNSKRNLAVKGEFKNPNQIKEIVLRGGSGAIVKVKDIATVADTYEDPKSYARLEGKNVITLNIIKRGGENLIIASDEIRKICDELQQTTFPKELKTVITGDQSEKTKVTLHDLVNTIIIGFILVTIILLFFMGTTNAIFVALSVPLSMCVAFLVMPSLFTGLLGYKTFSLNFIVLFSFLLALGIVVDDAIVVIENTHRIFANGKVPIVKAAKLAAGEVFMPVLSGTLTTLAPFFPLAFWQGTIGKFMFYLPITMIVTLFASLLVAYIINPVFAVSFMKPHPVGFKHRQINRGFWITSLVLALSVGIGYMVGFGAGNFMLTLFGLYLLNKFVLADASEHFQNKAWPKVQNLYARMMTHLIKTNLRAGGLLIATLFLLFFSFFLVGKYPPSVVFFPVAEPNFAYTYIKLPVGTDIKYTNEVCKQVEKRIQGVLGENNPLVASVISNVAVGANDPSSFDLSANTNAAKVTVAFVEFEKRHGKSTSELLKKIRDNIKGIPGAEIVVEQESGGPPTLKPILIELYGEDYKELASASQGLKRYLDSLQIDGVEELKSDLNITNPEITLNVNREQANREGISTYQIGMDVRTSLFGKEVTKFKTAEDDYPVNIRFQEDQRNVNTLLEQKITYRDMVMMGQLRSVPLSSVADLSYGNTLGGIKRKNQKRLVTISSNTLTDFNPNEVVAKVQAAVANYRKPDGVTINFGGEQEQQAETSAFLLGALAASIGLIVLILVLQFNSISKMVIIISEILFSVIGVLLGFVFFRMDIAIVMTGIGVIALAGIVVRNGILMVEFTEILLKQGMPLKEAIIEAGRTRMTPVLLTASATIMGLVPLAVGMNIDFVKMFTELNPNIFFGGDSVVFWGPLSWTIIYGLSFATFLTLILVPAMLLLTETLKMRILKNYDPNKSHGHEEVVIVEEKAVEGV